MNLRTYVSASLGAALLAAMAAPPAFSQATRAGTYTVQNPGGSYLGVGVLDITADRARALNLKEVRGAEVTRVEDNGPAAKAGIKQGDVVLEYNGMPVESVEQFVRMVRETPPGRTVKLVVWRNGATQDLTATIGERDGTMVQTPYGTVRVPDFSTMPPMEIPRFLWEWQSPTLGIEGEALGQERQFADYFGVRDGVLVKEVMRNSPAEKAGLKAGDVITKVNGATVASSRDISAQLRGDRNSTVTVTLTIVRDKKEMPLTVTFFQGGFANPNFPPPPGGGGGVGGGEPPQRF
jgi:serine protease Do